MVIGDEHREVVIAPQHWPLAEELFLKWGHIVSDDYIQVVDIDDITPELSAWGVPWKWR